MKPETLLIFLTCLWLVDVECTVRGVHPALQFSPLGQPGLKLRLTQNALDYINSLAADFLNEKLVTMNIPTISQRAAEGVVTVSNVSVLNVKPADTYNLRLQQEPDLIVWNMTNMDIGVKGDLSGQVKVVLKVTLKGTATIQANGVDYFISSSLYMDSNGRPQVIKAATSMITAPSMQLIFQIKTVDCKATVRDVSMRITGGGLFGLVVNSLKNTVAAQFKPILEKALCTVSREFIDVKANEKLKTMPILVLLPIRLPLNKRVFNITNLSDLDLDDMIEKVEDQVNEEADVDDHVLDFASAVDFSALMDSLVNSLWLDYRLLSEPLITADFIETESHGEISWRGKGDSPFNPPIIHEQQEFTPNKMFYVYATDFVTNSLLFHAYRRKMLEVTLTPDDPTFGSYMRTTCEDLFSFCFGDALPPLAIAYPDRELELVFQPLRAPAMLFNRDGHVNLDVKGVVFIFVRDEHIPGKKEQALALSVDMRADTSMTLTENGTRVIGDATIKRFVMAVRHSNIADVDNTQLDDIAVYSADILGQLVNEQLHKGLPLPLIAGASLSDPILTVHDRYILIETDIIIDPNTIDYFATDALRDA